MLDVVARGDLLPRAKLTMSETVFPLRCPSSERVMSPTRFSSAVAAMGASLIDLGQVVEVQEPVGVNGSTSTVITRFSSATG